MYFSKIFLASHILLLYLLYSTTLTAQEIYTPPKYLKKNYSLPYSKNGLTMVYKVTHHENLKENQKESASYFEKEIISIKGSKVLKKRNHPSHLSLYKDFYHIYDYKIGKAYLCYIHPNGRKIASLHNIRLTTIDKIPSVDKSKRKAILGYDCYQYQTKDKNGHVFSHYVSEEIKDSLSFNVHMPGVAFESEFVNGRLGTATKTAISITKDQVADSIFSLDGFEIKSPKEVKKINNDMFYSPMEIDKSNYEGKTIRDYKIGKTRKPKVKIIDIQIKPSHTDPSIKNCDFNHFVMYNRFSKQNKLLIYLPGTNGVPRGSKRNFLNTAVQQGYHVIDLAYVNKEHTQEVCRGQNIRNNPNCHAEFKNRRTFGVGTFKLIPDDPQDAIINRIAKLLIYLQKKDKKGNWNIFLENGQPNWELIALSGQSQGGAMAAYIAKHYKVAKIISFSGGCDRFLDGRIANWYFKKSKTPSNKWYGVYHVMERNARHWLRAYQAMKIPKDHIFQVSNPVKSKRNAHGAGVRSKSNELIWKQMLH